ncbi:hypothetical protein [Nostoc sp. UIC 10630]|nr:hypothetical protein [Nostoc sp. UIC 10630]NEU80369.1 hypothetical protein [Nostoc sp. UIC 10630]
MVRHTVGEECDRIFLKLTRCQLRSQFLSNCLDAIIRILTQFLIGTSR